MALAITAEQEQLVDSVSRFASRHAPIDKTRAAFDSIAAGELPPWWQEFTARGFHSVHLPEDVGGQGGSLGDMACVVEAAAAALLPGPLLSTATASAVARLAGPSTSSLIADLAAGATAVVILPEHSDVRAVRHGAGWRLSGASGSQLGISAAQRILLTAHTDDGDEQWFVLDASSQSADFAVEQQQGTDLCTDVGALHLTDHAVPESAALSGIPTERARCIVVAFAACAAAGTVRRCADAATDYIRTREQFGRPVGAFQALQHKAAVLLVNSELAAATAWDAVRAADESVEQHRLAAASAAVIAIGTAPDLVLDALLMFGAIGYTWEHDTHLYWRRATSLAASLGPLTHWSREVGELARTQKRSTAVNLGDVESEFRAWVAETLDRAQALQNDHPSDDARNPGLASGPQRDLLAREGLVAPTLPAPWGVGATAVQQVIIAEEFDKRPGLTTPSLGIAEWILPTILGSGTDRQRERFAVPILRGVQRWCQLFSEPGRRFGSGVAVDSSQPGRRGMARQRSQDLDLAGQPRALRSAAGAHGSGRAETSRHRLFPHRHDDAGYRGLTDQAGQRTRGVQRGLLHRRVRARRHARRRAGRRMGTGRVDDGRRTHRHRKLRHHRSRRRASANGGSRRPGTGCGATRARRRRGVYHRDQGDGAAGNPASCGGTGAGPTSSIAKYAMVTLLRRASTATLGLTGRIAMLEESDPAVFQPYFDAPAELIGGGTPEIQLTVIASMILGLPRK